MRYSSRKTFKNSSERYEKVAEERGIRQVVQYNTPRLKHLNQDAIRRLQRVTHTWRLGDRYYKLAYKHYGSSKYWWVIAWYNRRPTESHVKLGDLIFIPLPLEDVLRYLNI